MHRTAQTSPSSNNNTLTGLGDNDTLNGNGGTDTLVGGLGDDTYVTDGGDTLTEAAGEGTDTVQSSATIALSANLEDPLPTGSAAINGTGADVANVLTGNSGNNDTLTGLSRNDTLSGNGGTDTLARGLGDDIYGSDGGDTLTELAGEGIDTVQISVTHVLSANVEHLTLTGSSIVNGTGNVGDNTITGNGATNSPGASRSAASRSASIG